MKYLIILTLFNYGFAYLMSSSISLPKFSNEPAKNFIDKSKETYNNIVNSSSISPLWYRKLGLIPPDIINENNENKEYLNNTENICNTIYKPIEDYINNNTKITNLQGIIIGHTPQLGLHNKGINTACNKKIIRIDIGASKGFNTLFKKNDINRRTQVIEILENPDKNSNEKYIINILIKE